MLVNPEGFGLSKNFNDSRFRLETGLRNSKLNQGIQGPYRTEAEERQCFGEKSHLRNPWDLTLPAYDQR